MTNVALGPFLGQTENRAEQGPLVRPVAEAETFDTVLNALAQADAPPIPTQTDKTLVDLPVAETQADVPLEMSDADARHGIKVDDRVAYSAAPSVVAQDNPNGLGVAAQVSRGRETAISSDTMAAPRSRTQADPQMPEVSPKRRVAMQVHTAKEADGPRPAFTTPVAMPGAVPSENVPKTNDTPLRPLQNAVAGQMRSTPDLRQNAPEPARAPADTVARPPIERVEKVLPTAAADAASKTVVPLQATLRGSPSDGVPKWSTESAEPRHAWRADTEPRAASHVSAAPQAQRPPQIRPVPPAEVRIFELLDEKWAKEPLPLTASAPQQVAQQASPHAAAATAPHLASAETARLVSQQISVVVAQTKAGNTELMLNPPELGRVRLTLSATDGVLTLAVMADRPETSDLMRRHIEQLGQDIRDLGYSDVSFSFSGDSAAQDKEDRLPSVPDDTGIDDQAIAQPHLSTVLSVEGLDLRL